MSDYIGLPASRQLLSGTSLCRVGALRETDSCFVSSLLVQLQLAFSGRLSHGLGVSTGRTEGHRSLSATAVSLVLPARAAFLH